MSETNKSESALRVFVDSNILISAIHSDRSISGKLLKFVIEEHQLVICSYSITEISKVLQRKLPGLLTKWDRFLTSLEFELAYIIINGWSTNWFGNGLREKLNWN